MCSVYMPWSVTVDTEKYGAPSLEKVSVRLTRESDGKTWEFCNDPSQTTVTLNGQYFNVDLGGYGEPNAIIFRPGGHEAWHGLYTVEIFGLDEPLAYQVNLFHLVNADKPDPSRYFVDVDSDDWFLAEAEYAYEHGIMTGVGGGRFAPYDPVDRATAVQILYNLEGRPALPGNQGTPYGDVDPDVWYTDAVYWARSVQVAEGDGENFRPLDPISRKEFAAMLYRYAGYKGYSLSGAGDLGQYSDGDRVSSWAVESLAWANGNGLINGHDNGTIDPQGTTERAQAAAVLMRFCQQFVE